MVADFAPVHLVKRQFKAGDAETKMFILYIYIYVFGRAGKPKTSSSLARVAARRQ